VGDRFEAIVGAAHVSRPSAAEVCGARVEGVVRPGSAAEVAACLRAASESGIPVLPVGGGSKLGFGNPLDTALCIRLELGRLGEMTFDPDEGVAELDAGARLESVAQRAAALGKVTQLDPLHAGATVGGAIAVDPVTPESSLDSRLRGDLLGLEVALANGELTRSGGRVVKNVTGFDLVRLYCGSFGTLGVVTRAIVRLRAAPERNEVTCAPFPSLEAALESLAGAPGVGVSQCLAFRVGAPGVEVVTRFAGSAARVGEELARALGDSVPFERWSELRADLARPPAADSARVRLGARPSDLLVLCRGLASAAGESAPRLALARAGVVFGEVETERLVEVSAFAERAGAVFALERAPGAGAPPCDSFGAPPPALALMRELKARFDPTRVLSPGRFVAGI
jgi:glycolate oxidase FAD binding subunit